MNKDYEYDNETDVNDVISYMSDDLIEDEISSQISNSFGKKYHNYLEYYLDHYNIAIKDCGDSAYIGDITDKKNELLESVISSIQDKFSFTTNDEIEDREELAAILYDFFIMEYEDNLVLFIQNYMLKNKQSIVQEIKRIKGKGRDVSLAAKALFNNANDALLVNNLPFVVTQILPNLNLEGDLMIQLITRSDDNYTYNRINNLIENGDMILDDDFYSSFIKPLVNQEDGYTSIVTTIIRNLYTIIGTNEDSINICK